MGRLWQAVQQAEAPAVQRSTGSMSHSSDHNPVGAGLAAAIDVVSRHITPERSHLAWSDDVVATACMPR